MDFSLISELMGRLHPALVHLPIGILLIACFFELLSSGKRFSQLRPALPAMMLWGMIAALLSCLTGFLLYGNGEYEEELITKHEWSGFSLAAISILLYILYKRKANNKLIKLFSMLLLTLVFLTGHLGGSITHGEDFISAPLTGSAEAAPPMKPIPDIQNAVLFTDVVQPLFQARCYNCHGSKKQKGKLRLDSQEMIIKGGESKKTIVPGKPDESEMVERLLLPLNHKDHMPPKGKPQLNKEQIDVLQWWVSTGAAFNKKVNQLKQPENIKAVLLALQSGSSSKEKESTDVPEQLVAAGDSGIIRKLTMTGVTVTPVSRESNYLAANFVSAGGNVDSSLALLMNLKKQLLSLKLDGVELKDTSISNISAFTILRRLQLSNTSLNDQGLVKLKNLKELRSLNLVATKITAKGLIQLKDLKELKNIYLYKTAISEGEKIELKKIFPDANLDFGNYTLPMLKADTTEIKIKK
jgi:uncharacterized membrane protein